MSQNEIDKLSADNQKVDEIILIWELKGTTRMYLAWF